MGKETEFWGKNSVSAQSEKEVLMIDYLTHPKFLNYDQSALPSSQGGGGGMGVKTFRVLEALREVYSRNPLERMHQQNAKCKPIMRISSFP